MKRRPVCLVCLLLMLCIWLMDLAGYARISGNPLPESVQLYIEKHPEAVICGEVQQYQATEYSLSAYLKHVCLIVGSEQIPIKNLRVFLNRIKSSRLEPLLRFRENWKKFLSHEILENLIPGNSTPVRKSTIL